MSDNNGGGTGGDQNGSSSKKRKADDDKGPSPRGKKLTNDLLATLENPDLCDVTLVGSDGGRVPAIRVYLSARSEVLQHLLVGQFKEASEEEVHMDYPAAVLKALVHFCCTDGIPDIKSLDDDTLTSMRLAVKLVEAADYYGLTMLKTKASDAVFDILNSKIKEAETDEGSYVCSFFEEASQKPSLSFLHQSLYRGIKLRVPQSLVFGERPGATLLSSTTLRTIIQDPELKMFASAFFKAIKLWLDNEVPVEGEVLENQEERKNFAKQLVSNLDLRMISPKDLLGPVGESGLIEHSKIIQALQSQSSGGMVGIYGCQVDGLNVNGFYEEIPINARLEQVPSGDPTRTLKLKRFDKKAAPGSNETSFSIVVACQNPPEGTDIPPGGKIQSFRLLAPPSGAANLVLTGGSANKFCKDNRLLYIGARPAKPNANCDGTGIKWGLVASGDALVKKKTKCLPRMIIGPRLSTTEPCIPPDAF